MGLGVSYAHSFILPKANELIVFDHWSMDFAHLAEAIPIAKAPAKPHQILTCISVDVLLVCK
jgi:hypothetical protein